MRDRLFSIAKNGASSFDHNHFPRSDGTLLGVLESLEQNPDIGGDNIARICVPLSVPGE
jgi:hypothetical protein